MAVAGLWDNPLLAFNGPFCFLAGSIAQAEPSRGSAPSHRIFLDPMSHDSIRMYLTIATLVDRHKPKGRVVWHLAILAAGDLS